MLENQVSHKENYLQFLHKGIHSDKNNNSVFDKERNNIMVLNQSVIEQYIPVKFNLEQNCPNPFKGKTKIKYYVPYKTKVIIIVFNSYGFILEKMITNGHKAGVYEMEICLDGLPEGVYFYQLITDEYTETRSMELIKMN